MRILVIHGDYTVKSYDRFQEIIKNSRNKGWQIEKIDDKSLSLPEKLTAKSLFKSKILYVVDDFNKLTKKDFTWLSRNIETLESYLVLYSSKTITKTSLRALPKGFKEEIFELPKYIWKFLDSFYPGNGKSSLEFLHRMVQKDPIEFVFFLLARHMRDLYWVSLDVNSLPYQGWRVGKLKGQSNKFKEGNLKKIIKEMAKIDIKVKTSKANLIDSLDFLIATHLE